MKQNDPKKIRWHDRDEVLQREMLRLECLPVPAQQLIAATLIKIAEREFEADKLMITPERLAPDKLFGLQQGQRRMRSYDQDPEICRAFEYFFILSKENRQFMTTRLREVISLVEAFDVQCHLSGHQATPSELESLMRRYVELGREAAEDYIQGVSRTSQLEASLREAVNFHESSLED